MALRTQNSEERNDALNHALSGVDRTTRLVEQLLTLARYESDQIHSDQSSTDLHGTVIEVSSQVINQFHHKDIDFQFKGIESAAVKGDAGAIGILVRNILDNALRYTPSHGRVAVELSSVDSEIVLTVEDSGPGIANDQLENISHRFFRLNKGDAGGSGLGLSIAKKISDLYGVDLSFRNSDTLSGLKVMLRFPGA